MRTGMNYASDGIHVCLLSFGSGYLVSLTLINDRSACKGQHLVRAYCNNLPPLCLANTSSFEHCQNVNVRATEKQRAVTGPVTITVKN